MTPDLTISAEPRQAFCPRCGQSVRCIQVFEAPTFVFGIVFVAWNTATLVGCPRCVRIDLLKYFLLNILTANVLCWMVLP
jgi:hypothetical protein